MGMRKLLSSICVASLLAVGPAGSLADEGTKKSKEKEPAAEKPAKTEKPDKPEKPAKGERRSDNAAANEDKPAKGGKNRTQSEQAREQIEKQRRIAGELAERNRDRPRGGDDVPPATQPTAPTPGAPAVALTPEQVQEL